MSQNQHQKSLWVERKERQTGLEVDEYGYPIVSVVFYEERPPNVITEEIPAGLNNPRWDIETNKWIEG